MLDVILLRVKVLMVQKDFYITKLQNECNIYSYIYTLFILNILKRFKTFWSLINGDLAKMFNKNVTRCL